MNVVVDTSVWSLAFRQGVPDLPQVQRFSDLIRRGGSILLLGIILQEILQGFRSERGFARLRNRLAPFPLIEPERQDYIDAARLENRCASKGVHAGTIDFLIAAVCIRNRCMLLTADGDFSAIARYSNLRLLKPR